MLKGKNRAHFESLILNKLYSILRPFKQTNIIKEYGRIYIELNGHDYNSVAPALKKVFGLISFSPVRKVSLDFETIKAAALAELTDAENRPRTFKVAAKRANKQYPLDSLELQREVGAHLLKHTEGISVDVHHPNITVHVEVRHDAAYIFSQVISGAGGFPPGSSGKAMLMLSGGIDSPVAGWLAMRKGMNVEAVHFHSYPYTSERAKQKVLDLSKRLSEYAGHVKVHLVPFTEIQTGLKQHTRENLLITLMRRAMFRITQQLAAQHHAMAIVTGESLGQVASQTLPSMYTIGHGIELPILRPLITMDKNEIIRIAESIDTYETSILPYEDCCTIFLPKSPTTNPSLRVVESIESKQDWLEAAIEKAVEETEVVTISADKKEEVDAFF